MNPHNTRKNPDLHHKPNRYTHVIEATGNKTLYISGQVALDKNGNLIGENDLGLQTKQVFENIKNILVSYEASFDNVVKLTYFLVDMTQIQQVRNVRDSFISSTNLPASTAVEVKSLFRKDILIEIEAIAVL